MFAVRLRCRAEPNTRAPCARAYSAMWLPTKPVMPVMSKRILNLVYTRRRVLLRSFTKRAVVAKVSEAGH